MTKDEIKISDLPGVGPATAEKLADAGFNSLMSIAVASIGELTEAAGMGESAARKLIQNARSNLNMGFESGLDFLKKREQVVKISTGSKNLNNLVGGGFETGCITECFGMYASAKTQIAHSLAVHVQLPIEQGGANGIAVFIDTEGTFRPERIKQIAEGLGLNSEEVLSKIRVGRAFNSDHQMLMIDKVAEMIEKDKLPVKLVIVDSLMSHFRAEFVGRGTLAERQQKLNKHMHHLAKLANNNDLAIYVTNQVMAKPDQFFGDPTEAVGGNIVGHNSTFRIYLRKGKKGSRVAKLVDAPNIADGETMFYVVESGLSDEP